MTIRKIKKCHDRYKCKISNFVFIIFEKEKSKNNDFKLF